MVGFRVFFSSLPLGYPTIRDIVKKVVRTFAKALEETSSSLFLESLERAAQCFCSARQRDFYGAGGSAQVARDAANKFLRIGMRASVFDDGCMMSMSASLLQEEDVVVAFSYSGQNLPVLDVVRQARRNGAKVIAITNRLTSKLTKESDFALCVTADDSPLGGEHGAARMVQLSIVDALFMASGPTKSRGDRNEFEPDYVCGSNSRGTFRLTRNL